MLKFKVVREEVQSNNNIVSYTNVTSYFSYYTYLLDSTLTFNLVYINLIRKAHTMLISC